FQRAFHLLGRLRLDDQHVQAVAPVLRFERADWNDGVIAIRTSVNAHLRFLLHHADDCVGALLTSSVFPTGCSSPKMSLAISLPRKMTRRRCTSSSRLRKRPPACA